MIPKDCKRLAEVDFPIAEVSRHAAREKATPPGHPSRLHLWWARRPLASSRAVLLGLLWPDPCDQLCPQEFKEHARKQLRQVPACDPGDTDEDLRKALLRFIGAFANWDLAGNRTYLDVSRALVKAAHGHEAPLVVDPFAGGGSIPFEALRVCCEAFASDLNPVACLILKVLLEDIPRLGPDLAKELRRVGAEIKLRAQKELADLYPQDPDGATPIAYLWARTVRCESPNCGAEIPLARSFWLSKNSRRKQALRYRILRSTRESPRVEFEIFEPKTEKEVPAGSVSRAKATCLCCGSAAQPTVLSPSRVREQLVAQRGGADVVFDSNGRRTGGARMLAVVTNKSGEPGRRYRLPTERDYVAVREAQVRAERTLDQWERQGKKGMCPVPDEPLGRVPVPFGVINVWVYGIKQWGDLFTARQKATLVWLCSEVQRNNSENCAAVLACAVSRVAMSGVSLTRWNAVAEKMQHTFGRQALPIVWDFAEVVATASAPGNWESGYELIAEVIDTSRTCGVGQAQVADAAAHPMPDET